MTENTAEANDDQKRLATALAPLVAESLRPAIRRDIWQAAIVCSLVIWTVGYLLLIAKLIDQKPTNQINTLNVERPAGQEDLQREILQQQGHIKSSSLK